MSDPTNLLPLDHAWGARVDELTMQASDDLKCIVLLIAIQEKGKLIASVKGVPDSGPFADLAKNVPGLLLSVADAVLMQEALAKARPVQ